MSTDDDALARERAALRAVLPDEAFVDTCAVVGAFNVVDRIADATGIPLDAGMAAMSTELRKELDLARFASSANSPGLRGERSARAGSARRHPRGGEPAAAARGREP